MTIEIAKQLLGSLVAYEGDADDLYDVLVKKTVDVTGYFALTEAGHAKVYVPRKIRLNGGKLIPHIAITEDSTHWTKVSVGYDDGAGGSFTEIQEFSLDSDDAHSASWAAGTAQDISDIDSDEIPAGSYLGAVVTTSGNGQVTSFTLSFDVELID